MIFTSLLASLALASSASAQNGASAACPFNYPPSLNTTSSRNGLVFTIASGNPITNNRAIQLRPNPFFPGAFFGGLDASSSVLLGNFKDGGLYSQARDEFNQLYDLGPTGYLNLRREVGGTSQYSFGFADPSAWPGQVEAAWSAEGGSSDGTYGLYHEEPELIAHGFLLCEADIDLDHGPWYQLFYQTYSDVANDFPGCESVGVRTTIAASIENGSCNIGGVTSA
ncbi:hypothetical protein B0O99DRAFT_691063 [Bisporella sp. PMI_857]|nr:hypothetical protein B0O99DRAFT_691063 [Bisporella sp. PMI_857]